MSIVKKKIVKKNWGEEEAELEAGFEGWEGLQGLINLLFQRLRSQEHLKHWCLGSESNRHGAKHRGILSSFQAFFLSFQLFKITLNLLISQNKTKNPCQLESGQFGSKKKPTGTKWVSNSRFVFCRG